MTYPIFSLFFMRIKGDDYCYLGQYNDEYGRVYIPSLNKSSPSSYTESKIKALFYRLKCCRLCKLSFPGIALPLNVLLSNHSRQSAGSLPE